VTPTLSVEAVQDRETVLEVLPVTVRFAGAVGREVSAAPLVISMAETVA